MTYNIVDIMKNRKEVEQYRNYVEKMIQDNPQDSLLRYSKAFFRAADYKSSSRKNTLLFPVKVIKGRKSFGRLQFLISPLSKTDESLTGTPLGQRWVDRKFLILSHDLEYILYQEHLGIDEK
jgi:hypothetical protein